MDMVTIREFVTAQDRSEIYTYHTIFSFGRRRTDVDVAPSARRQRYSLSTVTQNFSAAATQLWDHPFSAFAVFQSACSPDSQIFAYISGTLNITSNELNVSLLAGL